MHGCTLKFWYIVAYHSHIVCLKWNSIAFLKRDLYLMAVTAMLFARQPVYKWGSVRLTFKPISYQKTL